MLEKINRDELLTALSPTVRQTVLELEEKGSTAEEICLLMEPNSIASLALKGGVSQSVFAKKFIAELRVLICTEDPRYSSDRVTLTTRGELSALWVTSFISGALAPHIGVTASILVPMVVVVLRSVLKVSRNAWCAETAQLGLEQVVIKDDALSAEPSVEDLKPE